MTAVIDIAIADEMGPFLNAIQSCCIDDRESDLWSTIERTA
jgi:hypothetical protein